MYLGILNRQILTDEMSLSQWYFQIEGLLFFVTMHCNKYEAVVQDI